MPCPATRSAFFRVSSIVPESPGQPGAVGVYPDPRKRSIQAPHESACSQRPWTKTTGVVPAPASDMIALLTRCLAAHYASGDKHVLVDEEEETMALQIGDTAPDFEAETTEGRIRFHDWIGDSWAVLSSHPKDFTPVCTTELGYMAKIKPQFERRNVKIMGLSVDSTGDHKKWADDIEETQGARPTTQSSVMPISKSPNYMECFPR